MNGKPIIISLGGSLIIPGTVDSDFLKKFKALILKFIEKGERFVLIAGGGKTARVYQDGLKGVQDTSTEELDWIGIDATILNAKLLRMIFAPLAHPEVVSNPTEELNFSEKILVASGWKPGWSTDLDAVLLAKNVGAKKLINLSNIDFVFDKDPKKFPDAVKIEDISWADFRKIIPEKWDPGLNSPFDPVASKEAEGLGLEVAILNGKNLENLEAHLAGKEFQGTRIHS